MSWIAEIRNVGVAYDGKMALRGATVTITSDSFLGIIGPNGGGKSTFLKALLGLVPLSEGSVRFMRDGEPVKTIRMGYLPQHNLIDRAFPISVREVLRSGIDRHHRFGFSGSSDDERLIDQMIERMGLQGKDRKAIGELSGGELQRTFLGRAMISVPDLLILDEPNSYVDMEFEGRLAELLREANRSSAILLVSHNIPAVQHMAKSLLCINRVAHYHPTTDISEQCLLETYLTR